MKAVRWRLKEWEWTISRSGAPSGEAAHASLQEVGGGEAGGQGQVEGRIQ